MASRTSRRGTTRMILVAALLALVAVSLPAHAVITPQLVGSSVETGYGALTHMERGCGHVDPYPGGEPGCFDQNDPPYTWTDGQTKYIESRWGVTLCGTPHAVDGVTPVPTGSSTALVTDGAGALIPGTVSFLSYKGNPKRVIRFTADPAARPHGFTAKDVGAAGIQVVWTALALQVDGTCAGQNQETEVFALDRKLPTQAKITSPSGFCYAAATRDPAQPGGSGGNWERSCLVTSPLTGNVTVKAEASDPLTRPFEDQEPDKWIETSGIAALVLRVWTCGDTVGTAICIVNSRFGSVKSTFVKSYTIELGCADANPVVATSPRCADFAEGTFSIPATDLSAGRWYGINVQAIDVNGFRSPVDPKLDRNSDNQGGPESNTIAFLYQGQ